MIEKCKNGKIALETLMAYFEQLMDSSEFEDYCPNGLQIEGKSEVAKIVVSPSVSLSVIEKAVSIGADAIVVHHGMFWKNEPRTITGVAKKKISLLLQHQISLIAYHLPLDFHKTLGNNYPVLQKLGCAEIEPFAGIGYKGVLQKRIEEQEFQGALDSFYGVNAIHLNRGRAVQSVAIVSGGGISFLRDAIESGVDAFITGEGSEWAWSLARENGIHLSVVGHYASEKVGVQLLGDQLRETFGLSVEFFTEDNPF